MRIQVDRNKSLEVRFPLLPAAAAAAAAAAVYALQVPQPEQTSILLLLFGNQLPLQLLPLPSSVRAGYLSSSPQVSTADALLLPAAAACCCRLLLHAAAVAPPPRAQVYALDKRFLDPRRPLRAKVTPEEAEERLMPYHELVVFNALQYPTQDKQVRNGGSREWFACACSLASRAEGSSFPACVAYQVLLLLTAVHAW
jgi:hypothetical protein